MFYTETLSQVFRCTEGSSWSDSSIRELQGASYNHFAGKDGARAFVTGCFKTHLTHDVRGLSAKEQKVRPILYHFQSLSPSSPSLHPSLQVRGWKAKRAIDSQQANTRVLAPYCSGDCRHWKAGNRSLTITPSTIKSER